MTFYLIFLAGAIRLYASKEAARRFCPQAFWKIIERRVEPIDDAWHWQDRQIGIMDLQEAA
jgi:hypothetical protein